MPDIQSLNIPQFKYQLEQELVGNILPFWMAHAVDKINGGFYGALTNDLKVHNEIPRSAILCGRILWTYSTAYQRLGNKEYLTMAQWIYDYLTQVFWDKEYSGVYWSVDSQGRPVSDHKHHYAQAFAIYGLTEYYRATKEPKSLELAQTLFQLLEKHAYDPKYQGYTEGSNRKWESLQDMRLSDKDINSRKSMNTMLHILEAYTNLMRVWKDTLLKAQHRALLENFQKYIVDSRTGHFNLFFDDAWHSLKKTISYGHDIEGSWLLWEAAEIQGDPELLNHTKETSLNMARAVYEEGIDNDGSLVYEGNAYGWTETFKAWWVQAEGMVGFYNAYQLSGQEHFRQASHCCWTYIQNKVIDREYGDWYKQLSKDGKPDNNHYKIGPWDCPYHHSRSCFEMLHRL